MVVSAALVHYGHDDAGEVLILTSVCSRKLGMEEKSFRSALLAQHGFMKKRIASH